MADQHKVALAGIAITVLLAIAALGLAMTGYINADLGWILFVLGIGGSALVIVRTWAPDLLRLDSIRKNPRDASRQVTQGGVPETPIEEILEDIRAVHGPDRARTIVGEAATERNKPGSRRLQGTSAAPDVVRSYIRKAPNHPRRELEILEDKEFSELIEKAENRTPEEQRGAFQQFAKVALKLVQALEDCGARSEVRDRDWQTVATVYGQANQALSGLPLDRYPEYAEDLSKVRGMLERREHPGKHQSPFVARDLRTRLTRDASRYQVS